MPTTIKGRALLVYFLILISGSLIHWYYTCKSWSLWPDGGYYYTPKRPCADELDNLNYCHNGMNTVWGIMHGINTNSVGSWAKEKFLLLQLTRCSGTIVTNYRGVSLCNFGAYDQENLKLATKTFNKEVDEEYSRFYSDIIEDLFRNIFIGTSIWLATFFAFNTIQWVLSGRKGN